MRIGFHLAPPAWIALLVLAAAFLIPDPAYPQQPVNQTDGPPSGPSMQTVYVYSGSTVTAICWARSIVNGGSRAAKIAISAVSKASAAVVTSSGHGLTLLTLPQVTISGATGAGWVTGINGTFTATVIDANTFSIPVDSTGFGVLAGTVVFQTSAPRQTVAEWAVQIFGYTGTNVTVKAWLQGSSTLGAKCTDAGSATVGVQ